MKSLFNINELLESISKLPADEQLKISEQIRKQALDNKKSLATINEKKTEYHSSRKGVKNMELTPGIEIKKDVHFGKPVIKGTRVPAELILGKLSNGMSFGDLMKEYDVTREQILAVLGYATHLLSMEEIKTI